MERLFGGEGIAHAIHDAILRIIGFGEKLELRPRRSAASEEVLSRAIAAAHARGIRDPSTEHLLLAVGEQEVPARILRDLGITNAAALVDARYPVTRPPVAHAIVQLRSAQLIANGRSAPMPGPMPPIFERFTPEARDAIGAGIDHARTCSEPYVEAVHLLFGVLNTPTGVVATVRAGYQWDIPANQFNVRPGSPQATDIFSSDARRIVAEDVLIIAERLNHRALTTGHLLNAILERPDEHTSQITRALPSISDLTARVIDALPGEEGA